MPAPLGQGDRFKTIKDKVATLYRKKGKSPAQAEEIGGAVAASIGRKKYLKERFQKMAAAGRKK